MAYTVNKQGEIIINNFEKGIAPSPHSGLANIQSGNITTEQGEVMCSFARSAQQQTNITGTFNIGGSDYLIGSGLTGTLQVGTWVTITSTGIAQLTNGTSYYVLDNAGGHYKLATAYSNDVSINIVNGYTTGTPVTFTTSGNIIGKPIATTTETYTTTSGAVAHRYYILDSNGRVFVNDSSPVVVGITAPTWYLPLLTTLTNATGIAVLNGWLMVLAGVRINCKSTSLLGNAWTPFVNAIMINNNAPHFALVGHQGKLYYTDGNFIGSIFPDSTLISGGTITTVNIQSYASYTAVTTVGTLTLINGSIPIISGTTQRVPACFFTGGTKPTALTVGTMYYIASDNSGTGLNFSVYAAPTGGAALDIQTGAVGTQYFNTFYPLSGGAGTGGDTILISSQRLNLPTFETAQSLVEVGNNLIVGCKGNVIYPWNQIGVLPNDLIPLPEANVINMVTVNNMAYIFAGNKGNIYVTNGNTASAVISVPDYTAGVPGTPTSYIEPIFTWGGAMYLRGRIYFSIQDQTATKAGNCGGIWSFVPTQNFFVGQDVGLSLRLENQASYGTYNGYSPVLIPSFEQNVISPQYWNAWWADISGASYGIDNTSTIPGTVCIIETDLIPTGTVLNKKTFSQIEYKLSTPLVNGESVAISYRQDSTSTWTSCGSAVVESATELAGYFPVNFEKGQWLQLQITLIPVASTNSSFVRLKEIIVR